MTLQILSNFTVSTRGTKMYGCTTDWQLAHSCTCVQFQPALRCNTQMASCPKFASRQPAVLLPGTCRHRRERARWDANYRPEAQRREQVHTLTIVAPVMMAMSSRYCVRRSPNPGALTAITLRLPRSLFTTSVARGSCSKSSAMMSRG